MMKYVLIVTLFLCQLFSVTIEDIETSYNEAYTSFEEQKNEQNITKLLDISQKLYENNEKLKQLKASLSPKVELLFQNEDNDTFEVGDSLDIKALTRHQHNPLYEKSLLEFNIYDNNTLIAHKQIELYESNSIHEESLSFEIIKPSKNYKICAVFIEKQAYEACKSFEATQLLQADAIIVSTSLNATKSDASILPYQDFYVFLPYKNLSDQPTQGSILIQDTTAGTTIFSSHFEHEASNEIKKAGVQIEHSKIYENQKLSITITLQGNQIKREKELFIAPYTWSLNFPKSLEVNKPQKFSITPPKEFIEPIEYTITPQGGILVATQTPAKGTVSAVTKENKSASIAIELKDATGKSVNQTIAIALNQDRVQPKKEITPQKTTPIGTIKDTTHTSGGLVYHYKVRFDGQRWIADGPFKAYFIKDNIYWDETVQGKLAKEGRFKNGRFRFDGKLTRYYGNARVASIEYYNEGEIIQNKMSYFYADGKTKEIRKVVDGHIIQASWSKDGKLEKLHESTKNGFINLKFGNTLTVTNSKSQKICIVRFHNNHISSIKCNYEDGQMLGEKSFSTNDVTTDFYLYTPYTHCTNRLNHKDKINKCPDYVELEFLKQLDRFIAILSSTKSGEYMKHLMFDNLVIAVGESVYYAVYNSMLEKNLFIHSNPTQKCSWLPNDVKSKFIDFDAHVKNKLLLFKKANNSHYDTIKKMIMQEFAKMYYPREKKHDDCHNEVVNFYKQMGYL